ncbi:MAG: flippase-like domain-containing protein [Candidatus Aminicenantes bacterium]|nr:flippase-like domain-containing protein [Candidatus Aminicenantes bacterium]
MKYLKIIIILAIAVLLLVFFFKDVDFNGVVKIVKDINPLYPLLFFVGTFLQYIIRAYRWGIILEPHKKKIPLKTLYNCTAVGFLLNFLPGRLGEPVKGLLLAREEKIDKSIGLASVVIERMIDFLMVIVIFLVSLLFIKDSTSPLLTKLKLASFYLLPVMLFLFLAFYLLNIPKVFSLVEKIVTFLAKIFPQRYRERLVRFLLKFLKGLKLNLPLTGFIRLLFASALVWISVIFFYWLLMPVFNIKTTFFGTVPYFSILVVFAAIPTPGMTGTIDMGSKLGLMQLYNASSETAVAYTLLVHFILIISWTIFGFTAVWMQGIDFKILKRIKEKKNHEMS